MVHVKEDTKEQLQQVRTQSPTRAAAAATTPIKQTTTVPPNLPPKNVATPTPPAKPANPFRVSGCDSNSVSGVGDTSKTSNDEQLVKFTNSKLLQRILTKLKLRRTNVKEVSEDDDDDDDDAGYDVETADGSSFKKRNDYRFRIQSRATWRSNWDTWAWFGSNKSTRSNKTLVDNNNHIKGIECTEKCKYIRHIIWQRQYTFVGR